MATQLSAGLSDTPLSLTLISTSPNNNSKKMFYGNVCTVCTDTAQGNTVFRRHYGVICCEACKCFFRRTVQMGREYKCRFGNSCPVGRTAINMKQVCQACRYNECLKSGMKVESVKKFPRKIKDSDKEKDTEGEGEEGETSIASTGRSRLTRLERTLRRKTNVSSSQGSTVAVKNGIPSVVVTVPENRVKQEALSSSELDLESDLDQFKFSITSPDLSVYSSVLDNAMPQLFGSMDSLHEKGSSAKASSCASSPGGSGGGGGEEPGTRNSKLTALSPLPAVNSQWSPLTSSSSSGSLKNSTSPASGSLASTVDHSSLKRSSSSSAGDPTNIQKKQRLEATLNQLATKGRQLPHGGPHQLSSLPSVHPYVVQIAVPVQEAPLGHHQQQSVQTAYNSFALPPQLVQANNMAYANNCGSAYNSHNCTPYATPVHSPIPSPHPHSIPPPLTAVVSSMHSFSQPATPINYGHHSMPTSPISLAAGSTTTPTSTIRPRYSNEQMFFPTSRDSGTANQLQFYPSSSYNSMLAPHLPSSSHQQQRRSPFSSLSFQTHSHNASRSLPTTPLAVEEDTEFLTPSVRHDSRGNLKVEVPEELQYQDQYEVELFSAPTSACPSPIPRPSRRLTLDTPEAEVEDVLDSLRLRIRHMFKWAKSEVDGFDDLSPLDQKALLRRTVSELVMLGFARVSIPYDGMLLLGSTGKVIRPTNQNSGVATVAAVTLSKLVIPMKVINMDDHELRLMKEIVLFNPESNGLRSRELVRQHRRTRHIELLEYSEKTEAGRFGELLCLLPPLYEVSMEVTEQLRLEQFVHEGEARIDALLLMSMISRGSAEEPMESVAE